MWVIEMLLNKKRKEKCNSLNHELGVPCLRKGYDETSALIGPSKCNFPARFREHYDKPTNERLLTFSARENFFAT